MATTTPSSNLLQQQKNGVRLNSHHLEATNDVDEETNTQDFNITDTMESVTKSSTEAMGDISNISNEYASFGAAGPRLFPNLFVFDGMFSGLNPDQVNFFDLLEVPNYDNMDGLYQ